MFVPQRPGVVSYKRCAEDEDFAGTFDFYKKAQCAPVNVNDYVAAFYDEHWWVGLVTQFDTETNDVLMKFMAPHGPRATFSWPRSDDIFCAGCLDTTSSQYLRPQQHHHQTEIIH